MKNSQALKEIVVKADEASLNNAIAEKHIAPESIVSVMLQPGSGWPSATPRRSIA